MMLLHELIQKRHWEMDVTVSDKPLDMGLVTSYYYYTHNIFTFIIYNNMIFMVFLYLYSVVLRQKLSYAGSSMHLSTG